MRHLWEQPFQAWAIDADCAVKPDGQNSVISFVISKWLLPELSFSDRWSRGTKTPGTRLVPRCRPREETRMFVRARALDCVYVIMVTASTVTERYHEDSCFYRCMDIVLF